MSVTCPDGHTSTATDFCDVCGAPIGTGPSSGPPGPPIATDGPPPAGSGPAPDPAEGPTDPASATGPTSGGAGATTLCPNCGALVSVDALFCEGCGRDMVTGQLPAAAPPPGESDDGTASAPVSTGWVAEVWVDEEWFAARGEGRCPTVGAPSTHPVADGSLIGRRSRSRGIDPDVDCSADGSVSGRQALLGFDGARWTVTDLGSTNGTFVAGAGDPIPTEPVAPNQAVELETGDRILVGAHTRVVIRAE